MPRSLVRHTVRTDTGQVVVSAKVEPLLEGTTTAITDAYPTETGGVSATSFTTNAQGEVVFWMDAYRDQIDLRISSQGSPVTQYAGQLGATQFTFATLTETVPVIAPNGTYASTPTSGVAATAVAVTEAQTITGAKTFNAGKLLDKGSIVFDVKAFGATGDGTTNDRAAVQAAIDAVSAAGGGTVFFPVGTYSIQTSLTVPSTVTLLGTGRGSAIKDGTGNSILLALTTGTVNIAIRNLRFTGSGVLGTAGRGAVWTEGTTRLTVAGCYFDALGTCAIVGNGIVDSSIYGNFINGGAEHGIYLSTDCADVLVFGNHIKNAGGNGGVSTVVGIKLANGAARSVVLGNVVSTAITEGILVESGAVDSLIQGNTFKSNTQRGVRVNAGSTGTRIIANVFKDNATGPVRDMGAVGTVIEGNTFDESLDAVYLDSAASRTIVRNNRWVAANAAGWALDVTADNVLVEGNDFSSGVTNALVIRAAADATRHRLNRYNVSGTTVSNSGTNTVPVANADTSGATLAALETEVNELKQLLRDQGLLVT